MKKLISFLLVLTIVCTMGTFAFSSYAQVDDTVYSAEDKGETVPTVTDPSETTTESESTDESSTAVSESKEETSDTTEGSEETSSSAEDTQETSEDVTSQTEITESSEDTTEPTEATTESSTQATLESTQTEATTEATETDVTVASSETATETTEETKVTESTKPSETQPVTSPTKPPVKKIYPKNIKKLKVKERTTNSITIKWSASKNHTRYVLFRGYEKADGTMQNYKRYKEITNEKKQTFTDKNLKSGLIYKYKLYACRKTKNYTTYSDPINVVTTTKMDAVENVKVTSASSSKISISWSKVRGAKKYYIYRRTPNSDYSLIAKKKDLKYTDRKVTPSTDYIYRVKAYRTVNKKTYTSSSGFVAATAGVSGVSGVSAKSYLNRALITWTPANNVSGYDIFYINPNGDYKLKATKQYPAYLSGKCTAGKTYRFAIKAFKNMGGEKIYSNSKIVDVKITDQAYGKTAKGTYVEICTETQEMYMYVNNKLYCHTNVVTGNYGSHDTTHGYHKVISRSSPARLRGSSGGSSWDVTVQYWLGFTYDGQGIHDSTWRPSSDYGKQTYKGNGSHGCVNTPYSAVGKMYSKAYIGMPVIVY
ncbi:MAG: L,D-transpeptidase family protein [Ruminococcus sp.]